METNDIFLLLIAVALLSAPIKHWKSRKTVRKRSARTTGRVVGHETGKTAAGLGTDSSGRVITKHAIIAYEVDGAPYQFVSTTGANWIIHPEGASFEVCYDPRDPENAGEPAGLFERVIGLLMGLAFPLIGFSIVIYLVINHSGFVG